MSLLLLGERAQSGMWDWLNHPAVAALQAVGIVGIAGYAAYQVALALRPATSKAVTNVDDLAQNFEEMQLEGDISDEELRTIRAVLGKTPTRRLRDES
ncbi:MAG: hypothetical protein KDA45_14920 [Planctomycetales bacterium]|nr:hypothetical protein [Planctomycetales bacterium]